MSIARLTVEKAGPLTTIQDQGRTGYMRFGVPHSGPIDRFAFAAAQAGVRNGENSALLEISLGGISLRCDEGIVGFCLCGGDFTAEVDGLSMGSWTTGIMHPGTRLRIREGGQGNWAYLAFGGTLQAEAWLGSSSTHLLAGLGGGRVSAGQEIIIEATHNPGNPRSMPPPDLRQIVEARIVMGPQDRYFPAEVRALLTSSCFRTSGKFDRMGRVMDGTPMIPDRLDMPSEPASRGSIQIDGEGKVTVLLADHQTTGGYPKLATVIGADVDRISQLPTGAELRFRSIEVEEATVLWRDHAEAKRRYLTEVTAGERSLDERLMRSNLIDGIIDASD